MPPPFATPQGRLILFVTQFLVASLNAAACHSPFVFSPDANSPASSVADAQHLVNQTRHEITEIVREVALAVRSDRTLQQFLTFLSDRVLRAMAAEGVVIWQRVTPSPQAPSPQARESATGQNSWVARSRLGPITDLAWNESATWIHQALLREVTESGTPTVVPPTPGATELNVPANPSSYPAAIVPIETNASGAGTEYAIEVFLEPGGSVATQRGYLRFVAQMADLAGEFIRRDEVRRWQQYRTLQARLGTLKYSLHESDNIPQIANQLVDGVAEVFDLARVALCSIQYSSARILAVSYVDSISHHSEAADVIRQAALTPLDAIQLHRIPTDDNASSEQPEQLHVACVVESQVNQSFRLIAFTENNASLEQVDRDLLAEVLDHAVLSIRSAHRINFIPGVRRITQLAVVSAAGSSRAVRFRRWLAPAILVTTVLLLAMLPVPLVVVGEGTIRPTAIDNYCATRNATVQAIHVDHGQRVSAGDLLMTLKDDELDRQITTLLGRRAVLIEQQSRWTEALVATASHKLESSGTFHHERNLVEEEMVSIDQQLGILYEIQQSLELRARRDGVVDAWQIQQRLTQRPLQRGEYLLGVIDENTSWMVDGRVPQDRISRVRDARDSGSLDVVVQSSSDVRRMWSGKLFQIGPVLRDPAKQISDTSVLVELVAAEAEGPRSLLDQTSLLAEPANGVPVQLTYQCGTSTLVYSLLQDTISALKSRWQLYSGRLIPEATDGEP